jgi:hypothetical protein
MVFKIKKSGRKMAFQVTGAFMGLVPLSLASELCQRVRISPLTSNFAIQYLLLLVSLPDSSFCTGCRAPRPAEGQEG